MTERRERVFLERVLDAPQRWLDRALPAGDAKILIVGTVRFLKQIVRSKTRARRGG
jgi:hypothetical protein